MTATEKMELVLNPALEQLDSLTKLKVFRKRNSIWCIDYNTKYVLYIEPRLSFRGYFLDVAVSIASFFRGIDYIAKPKGLHLGDCIKYDVVPDFQTLLQIQTTEQLAMLCQEQAADINCWLKDNIILPISQITDYSSFLRASEAIGKFRHPTLAPPLVAWDYLGMNDRRRAEQYLDNQINKAVWRDLTLPPPIKCIQEKQLITALSESELCEELQKREQMTESALKSYFGSRVWNSLQDGI